MLRSKGHLTLLTQHELKPAVLPGGDEALSNVAAENCRLVVEAVRSTLNWLVENEPSVGSSPSQDKNDGNPPHPNHSFIFDEGEGMVSGHLNFSRSLGSVDTLRSPSVIIGLDTIARINDLPVRSLTFQADTPEIVEIEYAPEISLTPCLAGSVIHRDPFHTAQGDFRADDPTYLHAAFALISAVQALKS